MASNAPTKPTSRFSTLKVFKFAGTAASKPPPLPPKDPYYLKNTNPSLTSLSPDSLSLPGTPLSPQYARRGSPNPSSSNMSLISSAASMSPPLVQDQPASSQSKKDTNAKGFFKFGKRSPRPPTASSSELSQSPPATDDEGISLPWNFQHHMHVDEAFTGLPPSWSASLAEAGFTEEEIANIQARRTATRSPNYVYSERPATPSTSSPVLAHPMPRTTSLPRKYSDASLRQPNNRPPLPPSMASTPSLPRRQFSADSSSNQVSIYSKSETSSLAEDSSPSQYVYVNRKPSPSTRPTLSPDTSINTPPRGALRVTNGVAASPGILSPPPAYASPPPPLSSTSTITSNEKRTPTSPYQYQSFAPRLSADTSVSSDVSPPSSASSHSHSSSTSSRNKTKRRSKRFTVLPPRLSLTHDESSDLSSWSEALISSIPSELSFDSSPASTSASFASPSFLSGSTSFTSTSASASTSFTSTQTKSTPPSKLTSPSLSSSFKPLELNFKSSTSSYSTSTSSKSPNLPTTSPIATTTTTAKRPPPPTRPVPLPTPLLTPPPLRSNTRDNPSSSPSTPVWNDLLVGVRRDEYQYSPSSSPYTPAFSEAHSPTLPLSPSPGSRMEDGERTGDLEGYKDDTMFLSIGGKERDSNRDSSTSTVSTATVTPSRTGIVKPSSALTEVGSEKDGEKDAPPGSPHSSHFSSEESGSGSGSSDSRSQDQTTTPITDGGSSPSLSKGPPSPLLPSPSPSPSPLKTLFPPSSFTPTAVHSMLSQTDTFGGVVDEDGEEEDADDDEDDDDDAEEADVISNPHRPRIVISGSTDLDVLSPLSSSTDAPSPARSPLQRYRGWLSEVVAPLEEYIDDAVDPRDFYVDLQEIAEGESGSVYAARVINGHKLRLATRVKARDNNVLQNGKPMLVAIKNVPILPSGSPKLDDLRRELGLLKELGMGPGLGVGKGAGGCEHVLGMDAVYVDLVEDSLWIRMELMERSLADVVALVEAGLMLQDRMVARFASDMLLALDYIHKLKIAHRDVRSDNFLLNAQGVLKLADFSNAVQVTPEHPTCSDPAGVIFWQAPEVRSGPYNPLKIDVWSFGATLWEMVEAQPPFADTQKIADRWPPLTQPNLYPPAFHELLRLCSEPAASRPDPSALLKNSFIGNACGRPVIIQLLSQCIAMEKTLQEGDTSYGPDS